MQILKYSVEAFLTFNEREIEDFLEICEKLIENMPINNSSIFKLKSATQELIVNSIEHGYEKKQGKVSFSIFMHDNKMTIVISDEGKGVSNLTPGDLPENMTLETMKNRGWGLIILKGLSESFVVEQNQPKGTKVTVTFVNN